MSVSWKEEVIAGILVLALIALSIWFSWRIWRECRDSGRSVLYCMQMLNKG